MQQRGNSQETGRPHCSQFFFVSVRYRVASMVQCLTNRRSGEQVRSDAVVTWEREPGQVLGARSDRP